jgi:hypothetical protein
MSDAPNCESDNHPYVLLARTSSFSAEDWTTFDVVESGASFDLLRRRN